jgi:hypothetical protein
MALVGADMVQAVSAAMTITGSNTAACVARWLRLSNLAFPNHSFACPVIVTSSSPRRGAPAAPQSKKPRGRRAARLV